MSSGSEVRKRAKAALALACIEERIAEARRALDAQDAALLVARLEDAVCAARNFRRYKEQSVSAETLARMAARLEKARA